MASGLLAQRSCQPPLRRIHDLTDGDDALGVPGTEQEQERAVEPHRGRWLRARSAVTQPTLDEEAPPLVASPYFPVVFERTFS